MVYETLNLSEVWQSYDNFMKVKLNTNSQCFRSELYRPLIVTHPSYTQDHGESVVLSYDPLPPTDSVSAYTRPPR